jgi:5-methylcytosine-specific restriction endonuclease McrA
MSRRIASLKPQVSVANLSRAAAFPEGRREEYAQRRKKFYDSGLWQRTRDAKLRRDPFCQACAYENVITQGQHVDHWTALADGGHPTADENLVTLCVSHHSIKTLAERNGTEFPKIVPSKPLTLSIA